MDSPPPQPSSPCNLVIKINALKSGTSDIKDVICTKLGVKDFCDVSVAKIKDKSGLSKQIISAHLLTLIKLSDNISKTTTICNSDLDSTKFINICDTVNIQSTLSNQSNFLTSIDTQLTELKSFITQLNDRPATSCVEKESQPTVEISTPEPCIKHCAIDFINDDDSAKLREFLSKNDYHVENGHSVKNFGEEYKYNGAADSTSEPIPIEIVEIIDKIKDLYPGVEINECLINRYETGESFLSGHSDDEPNINPESDIFCLSLGQSRDIVFKDKFSGSEATHTAVDRSLYIMTRTSQAYYTHRIDADTCRSVRYSLTFRHVNKHYLRSTIVIGDSNTKHLMFGEGKGTFGVGLPGKRVKAATVEEINPHDCAAYANVILVVGTNNLRNKYISCRDDICNVFKSFEEKINIIQKLRKDIKVIIIPVFPTRIADMTRHIACYNRMLYEYVGSCPRYNVKLPPIYEFVDREGLLRRDFTRVGDYIHLNSLGLSRLAFVIKSAIFNRTQYTNNSSGRGSGSSPTGQRGESRPA